MNAAEEWVPRRRPHGKVVPMQHKRHDISVGDLRQLISYNPDTGEFVWLTRPLSMFSESRHMNIWNVRYSGKVAGSILTSGYYGIRIFHKAYKAHRIAWALHYGEWPEADIDHINNNRLDNRIINLRCATPQQNGCNKLKHRTATSRYKGVSWKKKSNKWTAQIMCHGKMHYLGLFSNEQDAHAAYVKAAHELHGQFANT